MQEMRKGRRRGTSHVVVLAASVMAAAWTWAAESNAVALRPLGETGPVYLTSGVLEFPLDWESGLVPAAATEAVMLVKGYHVNARVTAARPAQSISYAIFDAGAEPFNDSLTVTLAFVSGGVTNAGYSQNYELRRATFAQDRVLTVPTTDNLWRTCRLPLDLPFDESWFDGVPTWFVTSNLVTGTMYRPVPPLDGPSHDYGVLVLNKSKCGSSNRLNMRIWSGQSLMAEVNLDGCPGMGLIVR